MTRLESGPHKDAVRFSNGTEVSLQRLDRGLTAVLLGSDAELIDISKVTGKMPEYA
ncbi:MAG: hypothetical protein JSR91_03955 [Proteobacteria bacterium]|nr:hypothetical protein [Pseudomonadota bacterium]